MRVLESEANIVERRCQEKAEDSPRRTQRAQRKENPREGETKNCLTSFFKKYRGIKGFQSPPRPGQAFDSRTIAKSKGGEKAKRLDGEGRSRFMMKEKTKGCP
jgi:hypothetical protein